MRRSDYDYKLPPELIAQEPAARRDASRLLVLHRETGELEHRRFRDLPEYLHAGDRLVVNDTRVIPGRLFGVREGHTGRVEFLLVRPLDDPRRYLCLARPGKKLSPGTRVLLGESRLPAVVEAAEDPSRRVLVFPPDTDPAAFLEREGHIPLPPYIRREDGAEDRDRYQTVFADEAGAVAAPTAGLHFTPDLLERLAGQGVGSTRLTLHVGPGTFVPVTAEDPRDHVLEAERYRLTARAADEINATRRAGGRIVAVGTTSVRTLETAAASTTPGAGWEARSGEGWTDRFIVPPYRFRMVDALVTNFHLPGSSLLLLVAAFAGFERMTAAYAEAIRREYRFYSYGDAMLIL